MRAVHKPTYTPAEQHYVDWYNTRVPLWLYLGIIALTLLLALSNFISRFLAHARTKRFHSLHSPAQGRGRHWSSAALAWWRKKSYAPSRVLRWLGMETAAQAAVITGYFLLNFLIVGMGATGAIDYQAHHCARLFNSNLPILVGLAAKELSFIGWLTGLSFGTLNVFHRWVARLLFILMCVHIGGRVYVNDPRVNPTLEYNRYQAWGIAATVFFGSMILVSPRTVRRRWYKPFILSHVALFFLACICLSFHRPQVAPFTIVALILYASDRIVRGISMIWYNFFKPTSRGQGPSAYVEVLSTDTLRLTFHTSKPWYPGQHTFLHLPLLGAGGHAFSISSTYLPVTHTRLSSPPASASQVFIIRVHSGLTKALYDQTMEHVRSAWSAPGAELAPLNPSPYLCAPVWPVWSEGPYGEKLKMHRFETVVLITGGSGVTFALPLLADLVRRKRIEGEGGKRIATKRVVFSWIIRDAAHVDWIKDTLRDALSFAPPNWLDVQIYVTGTTPSTSVELKEEEEEPDVWIRYVPQRMASPDPEAHSLTPIESIFTASRDTFRASRPLLGTEEGSNSLPSFVAADESFAYGDISGAVSTATLPGALLGGTSIRSGLSWTTQTHDGQEVTLALKSGRPDIRSVLTGAIEESDYADSVTVGVCGPTSLTNGVSTAVAEAIDPGKVLLGEHRRNVQLHLETFGW